MEEPLLTQFAAENDEEQQRAAAAAPATHLASCLPTAWTSLPADLNAPGKLLGSIGLEWM
jgi:hypothetical protein